MYLDLRRLELAPELTRSVAEALSGSQFINFGAAGSNGGQSAVATGSDDVLRMVQTLMAAKVLTQPPPAEDGASRPKSTPGDGGATAQSSPAVRLPTKH